MRAKLTVTSAFVFVACGRSNTDQLYEAANQSDPAANGMEPLGDLPEAGNDAAEGKGTAAQ